MHPLSDVIFLSSLSNCFAKILWGGGWAVVSTGLWTHFPLVPRLCLGLPCHCWPLPLNSAASASMVSVGLGSAPGDPWQPPTGRLGPCSAPISFRHLSVYQVLHPNNPWSRGPPQDHLSHHSCPIPRVLVGIRRLSKWSWARPSSQWPPGVSSRTMEPRFADTLDIPLTFLACLPCSPWGQTGETRTWFWQCDLPPVSPSFPQYPGMARTGLSRYFLLCSMLPFFCNCKSPVLGGKTLILEDTRTPVFIMALFTIGKTWKQHRCPSTDDWIKVMWHVYILLLNYFVL